MIDLLTPLTSHYACSGTAGLTDEIGTADDFSENGTVLEVVDGKFDEARGPFSTANRFSNIANNDWEVRTGSGFFGASFSCWFRITSNTGIDTIFNIGTVATSTRQCLLRGMWEGVGDTANDDIAALLIYDWALDDGTHQVGGAVRLDQGAFPLNEWMFIGCTFDTTTDTSSLFLGIPSEGTYFDSRSMAGWDAFQAAIAGIVTIGCDSNASDPVNGNIDHISWWNGYVVSQSEFLFLYNGGSGRTLDQYVEVAPNTLSRHLRARLKAGK